MEQMPKLAKGHVGLPWDWTHQHMVFGAPDTAKRLNEVTQDPRYSQQWTRRVLQQIAPEVQRDPDEPLKCDWAESTGSTNTFAGPPSTFPAKYSFDAGNPTPDCVNDFLVFALPIAGSSSQFNLIGFNNLYVNNSNTGFCAGTLPTAIFDYNVSKSSGAPSAPTLSLDGTRIAFVERSTQARLNVLIWKSGDVATTFPNAKNASTLSTCAASNPTAPCEYSLKYSTTTAKYSSPFVDYNTDTAYVTDDAGKLYAITPVFNGGTPAVKTGYPITLGANAMTPPVYDFSSQNVFAADTGTGTLYYVRTTTSSSGSCSSGSPPCKGSATVSLGGSGTVRVVDPVIVDSTNGKVFAFTNAAAVVQTNMTLSASSVVTASLGTNSQNSVIYSGAFDNNYYTSPSSGFLYACGTDASGIPHLYAFGFNASAVMNTTPVGSSQATTGLASCSPLTEVYNQSLSQDLLLGSLSNNCTSGAAGCVISADITSGYPSSFVSQTENGGTQGINIDNVTNASSGGDSSTNIYFLNQNATSTCNVFTDNVPPLTTTTTKSCMIKLTQNGLQ